jgi:carbonic anhydrase/acetyltransferase-like protein (isoleucine patch superfamily)
MIYPHHGVFPKIHETAFIAPSADVIGEVSIGESSSIWFQVVIRGDVNTIDIGARTNIQDHSMLHVTRDRAPLKIGDDVTVGHRVLLHGCTIGSRVLIGMGAIIMDHAVIEDDVVIGAGSLVTQGMRIPSGVLAFGVPAKVIRPLKPEELEFLKQSAQNYVKDSIEYRKELLPPKKWGSEKIDQLLVEDK